MSSEYATKALPAVASWSVSQRDTRLSVTRFRHRRSHKPTRAEEPQRACGTRSSDFTAPAKRQSHPS